MFSLAGYAVIAPRAFWYAKMCQIYFRPGLDALPNTLVAWGSPFAIPLDACGASTFGFQTLTTNWRAVCCTACCRTQSTTNRTSGVWVIVYRLTWLPRKKQR